MNASFLAGSRVARPSMESTNRVASAALNYNRRCDSVGPWGGCGKSSWSVHLTVTPIPLRSQSDVSAARPQTAGATKASTDLRHEPVAPHEKPLMWVSDEVVWCYSNGGDWLRRVEAIVQDRVTRL